MRDIDLAVVHCTATKEGVPVSRSTVDEWHKARGWKGIGYHRLIGLDGSIDVGRPDWQIGAHVAGWNAHSLGVCYVGGLDAQGNPKDTRTPAQKEAILKVINEWMGKYPVKRIAGHNEFAAKACPCFDAGEAYQHMTRPDWTPAHVIAKVGGTPDFVLGEGDFGPKVREWQESLCEYAYPEIVVDGDFGPDTTEKTMWFQTVRGIVADGLVGPQTFDEMEAVLDCLVE